ncbi:hypothetical protein GCM10009665_40420 [Kitasatospora nipponensis]|uniref:Phospholipase D-like protein n=1 Tax=Kitasatospora nipponensis TaxID=258049 RepID=A0ABP4H4Y2_9ACTN
MWWQCIVLVVASFFFPTLALLYFIGGPYYRDRPRSAQERPQGSGQRR